MAGVEVSAWGAVRNWRTWYLALINLCDSTVKYAIIYWCPLIIYHMVGENMPHATGEAVVPHDAVVALLTALPFGFAAVFMLVNARHSAATGEAVDAAAGGVCVCVCVRACVHACPSTQSLCWDKAVVSHSSTNHVRSSSCLMHRRGKAMACDHPSCDKLPSSGINVAYNGTQPLLGIHITAGSNTGLGA
jgi:hypothetical protein